MSMPGRPVAVVGIGYSGVYRDAGSPDTAVLSLQACRAALTDAGLRAAEVDGVFEYQYAGESPTSLWMQHALGARDLGGYCDIMGTGASGLSGALVATAAVASGTCDTALAFRSMDKQTANTGSSSQALSIAYGSPFHEELSAPYGLFGVIPTVGMRMSRRAKLLGGAAEDYGLVALNARRWAALNPRAAQKTPLTMDDYLAAKVLCDPVRILDCDLPVSGSCAVILTTLERARDLRQPPVVIHAHAMGTGDGDWLYSSHFLEGGLKSCAERLWARSELKAKDMDLAQLYDGFTYVTLSWIEALGFCGPGEAGAWMDGGRKVGPGGRLPMNTTGGQLAEGRLHGLSFLAEAVLQLRGGAGDRQVPGAAHAVVGASFGPQVGGMVLARA